MISRKIWSKHDSFIAKITVQTGSEQPIRILVYDAGQENTILVDKSQIISGKYTYYARLPLTGWNTIVSVFNENTPDDDSSFKVLSVTQMELERKLAVDDIANTDMRTFIKFSQRFAFNAGILAADQIYQSSNGKFFIRYVPKIIDYDSGKEIATPYRISMNDGLIEANQSMIINYSVPMRIILQQHEFSHFFVNKDGYWELEADLNALVPYLSIGYPRYDALCAFGATFDNNDTPENQHRWDVIKKFITDFEKSNSIIDG